MADEYLSSLLKNISETVNDTKDEARKSTELLRSSMDGIKDESRKSSELFRSTIDDMNKRITVLELEHKENKRVIQEHLMDSKQDSKDKRNLLFFPFIYTGFGILMSVAISYIIEFIKQALKNK